jgi:DNA-directed RNA polymerase subunit omega
MQTYLLEKASTVIPVTQVLVNVISKRVRELSQGARPLVEVDLKWGYSDIALKEVIDGKLSYEMNSAPAIKVVEPQTLKQTKASSTKKAA